MGWRDLENLVESDCQLCLGAGFYEVIFELVKSGGHMGRLVKAVRVYGTGLGKIDGYRVISRCHLCNAAYHRGVPAEIGPWPDHQVDELLGRDEWENNPKF